MIMIQEQLRAARALLRLDQAELARRAHVAPVTIRRIEAADGTARVAPTTLESVRRALEEAGAEFIPHGVKRRIDGADRATLLQDLKAISERSAGRLRGQRVLTEADLYDESGLPG